MSPRYARGEVHPGLVVAGVVVALALAWWLARPDPTREVRSTREQASTLEQSSTQPSRAPRAAQPESGIDPEVGVEDANKPLYRWTDQAGVVHFTDVAPADRPYVEVDVDPERNVVKFPDPPDLPEP